MGIPPVVVFCSLSGIPDTWAEGGGGGGRGAGGEGRGGQGRGGRVGGVGVKLSILHTQSSRPNRIHVYMVSSTVCIVPVCV